MNGFFNGRFNGIKLPSHGGTGNSSGMLDFSASVNPFELPGSVKNAFRRSLEFIGNYPDSRSSLLVKAVADYFGISRDRLLITNGSSEAFSIIAASMLGPGKSSLILSPCYSDYGHVTKLSGTNLDVYRLDAKKRFIPDPDDVLKRIESLKPDLIWLCSPNNPTGVVLEHELIFRIAAAAEEYGGFVVLDEAYSAFSMGAPSLITVKVPDNLVIVRSMTKDFGIPGLRLGFIYASSWLVNIFELCKPCWSVSVPAQFVGESLFDEIGYYRSCWNEVEESRCLLLEGLAGCSIFPLEHSANSCSIFIFFMIPERMESEQFVRAMAADGIIVRDCRSMGAPGYCRIGVKRPKDNEKLLKILGKVINE